MKVEKGNSRIEGTSKREEEINILEDLSRTCRSKSKKGDDKQETTRRNGRRKNVKDEVRLSKSGMRLKQ